MYPPDLNPVISNLGEATPRDHPDRDARKPSTLPPATRSPSVALPYPTANAPWAATGFSSSASYIGNTSAERSVLTTSPLPRPSSQIEHMTRIGFQFHKTEATSNHRVYKSNVLEAIADDVNQAAVSIPRYRPIATRNEH